MQELKSTRHAKYNLNYHGVWIPNGRETLKELVRTRLKDILYAIAKSKDIEILGLEIMPDYIHLFVSAKPSLSPARIVGYFKGISARQYNSRYKPQIQWTRSYYVGTAGTVTSETIKKYIEEQTNVENY